MGRILSYCQLPGSSWLRTKTARPDSFARSHGSEYSLIRDPQTPKLLHSTRTGRWREDARHTLDLSGTGVHPTAPHRAAATSLKGSVLWCAPPIATWIAVISVTVHGPPHSPPATTPFRLYSDLQLMDPKSRQSKHRDDILFSLNVVIQGLSLAEKLATVAPAKTVFSVVSDILTMIRVSPIYPA